MVSYSEKDTNLMELILDLPVHNKAKRCSTTELTDRIFLNIWLFLIDEGKILLRGDIFLLGVDSNINGIEFSIIWLIKIALRLKAPCPPCGGSISRMTSAESLSSEIKVFISNLKKCSIRISTKIHGIDFSVQLKQIQANHTKKFLK